MKKIKVIQFRKREMLIERKIICERNDPLLNDFFEATRPAKTTGFGRLVIHKGQALKNKVRARVLQKQEGPWNLDKGEGEGQIALTSECVGFKTNCESNIKSRGIVPAEKALSDIVK